MRTHKWCEEGLILILAVSAMLTGCTPEKYSGGTGSQRNPYKIETVYDLLAMAADTNDYGAHFKLTADIDLGPKVPGGQVFNTAVIANDINGSSCDYNGIAFTGVFDGAGHKIMNLTINTFGAGSDYLGLFGRISGGKVKNLLLENISIKGGDGSYYIGGLAGCNNKSSIDNCSSTGIVVSGKNCDSIGGLLGDNCLGNIIDSSSMCEIRSGSYSSNLGGLVGGNIGVINGCHSTGAVAGGTTSMWLGGLVGSNSGTIRNCSATGTVTGGEYSYNLGGLVGESSNGIIVNCNPIATAEAKFPQIDSFFALNK